MDGQATQGIVRFFMDLPDPRADNVIHKLHDVLVIAVCAVICGADGWVEVELFGKSKASWFKSFLDLPGGIPSHDTFGRVFALLRPDAFERCFTHWAASVAQRSEGRLIAIDGKAIRRSFEHAWDKSGMTHLVSAFVEANHMVFSQIAVADKSNEIQAIPRLLALLDLEGAVVTIDAMGCQQEVAGEVTERGGDYVLAVKENQKTLHGRVKALLDEAILDDLDGLSHARSTDGGHGRVETREVWVCRELSGLGGKLPDLWPGLLAVVAVESQREVLGSDKPASVERRYFITSLKDADARTLARLIRGHWSVENNLHWQLDVSFCEDQRRIRKGYGAENYSRLCRLALNLLKKDKTLKVGIHAKRMKAGWDEHYLLRLLTT
jgi:predicted transposase YbfD/YdcC